MTISEMEGSNKEYLTLRDVSGVLRCNPDSLRRQARSDASKLGFQVIIVNSRIKVPRLPFLHFIKSTLGINK